MWMFVVCLPPHLGGRVRELMMMLMAMAMMMMMMMIDDDDDDDDERTCLQLSRCAAILYIFTQ